MNRSLFAAAGAAIFIVVSSGLAKADDRPLIWQPIKNSNTSYSVKLGMKLPTRLEPQAGFDVGVDANKGGDIINTPVKFWGSVKTATAKRPAYQMQRDVGVNLDGIAGSASISMNYYEKQIATPLINVERQASYVMRYDGVQGDWTGLDTNQSIKFRRQDTGTALIASADATGSFDRFGASFGLEQKLGDNITLTGRVNRNFSAADTIASVNAHYSYKW